MEFIRKTNLWVRLFVFILFLYSCKGEHEPVSPELYNGKINVIPKPEVIYNYTPDKFLTLDENTVIYTTKVLENEALYLKEVLEALVAFKVPIVYKEDRKDLFRNPDSNTVTIIMDCRHCLENKDSLIENYTLWVRESKRKKEKIIAKQVVLFSNSPSGALRGIQTLRQLIHTSTNQLKQNSLTLPYIWMLDSPKFKHRGLMLDVCRHFFSLDVIKKYIDLLTFYKMNVLHLHLTEDQGWRIESEKYPKLNEISSWRTEADGSKYGGFYTKEQLKELVAYAQERHITIIPEIELPGHSQAALAAYPYLACDGHNDTIEVVNDWGVFKEIYCAGNDSTFAFLENILAEVMEIFPSKYIHIGGDEAPKYRWENCAKCQKRIKEEGLHNEHELQSYFINRIEKYLNQNNRELIGWDEILEGGLSPNATVQSWRGMQGGIDAALAGHNAIMSPTSHCYLDYELDKIDLEKIYSFDPIPKDLSEDKHQFIIGGECNMWTEHVPDEKKLDEMISPRMQALAEVLWSYPKNRDFEDFYNRLQFHYPVLKTKNIHYGAETIPAQIGLLFGSDMEYIILEKNLPDIRLEHRWSCDTCVFTRYHHEIPLEGSGRLEVVAFKESDIYGDTLFQDFEYHRGLMCETEYKENYNEWYTAGGDSALVNGKLGSLNFRDGNWQGFFGNNAQMILDLGKDTPINSVASNFYQYNNAWIFSPQEYKVSFSGDGKDWKTLGTTSTTVSPQKRGKFIEKLEVATDQNNVVEARYLKVEVKSVGIVPEWHEAAGSKAWIFMDEIIVN